MNETGTEQQTLWDGFCPYCGAAIEEVEDCDEQGFHISFRCLGPEKHHFPGERNLDGYSPVWEGEE